MASEDRPEYTLDALDRHVRLLDAAFRIRAATARVVNTLQRHPTERGRILLALQNLDLGAIEDGELLAEPEEDPEIFALVATAVESAANRAGRQ